MANVEKNKGATALGAAVVGAAVGAAAVALANKENREKVKKTLQKAKMEGKKQLDRWDKGTHQAMSEIRKKTDQGKEKLEAGKKELEEKVDDLPED